MELGFLKVLTKEGAGMSEDKLLATSTLVSCPISSRRVDANMIRVISFQVALFTVILLLTQESFFAWVLFFDFIMRTLRLSRFSLFYVIGQFVLTLWGVAPKLCDESPKRFALYMGLVISMVLVLLFVVGFTSVAMVIATILFVCALLETLLDFCIGCKIYYGLQLLRGVWENDRNFK